MRHTNQFELVWRFLCFKGVAWVLASITKKERILSNSFQCLQDWKEFESFLVGMFNIYNIFRHDI